MVGSRERTGVAYDVVLYGDVLERPRKEVSILIKASMREEPLFVSRRTPEGSKLEYAEYG